MILATGDESPSFSSRHTSQTGSHQQGGVWGCRLAAYSGSLVVESSLSPEKQCPVFAWAERACQAQEENPTAWDTLSCSATIISPIPDSNRRNLSSLGFAYPSSSSTLQKQGQGWPFISHPSCHLHHPVLTIPSPYSNNCSEINAMVLQNTCMVLAQDNIPCQGLPGEHCPGHWHLLWDQTLTVTQSKSLHSR